MIWNHDNFCAMDFETSGMLPEYALQPWRIRSDDMWATSLVWMHVEGKQAVTEGGLFPSVDILRKFLEWARDEKRIIVGWNVIFDIGVLIGYGLTDLVFECRWLDAMHLYRHYFIEPEYDETGRNKKSYSLKQAVREYLPEHANYEVDIDYHSTDPAELKKLHEYNILDVAFTLKLAKFFYTALSRKQRACAMLEAHCLPLVAQANVEGILIDTIAANNLGAELTDTSKKMLKKLSAHGVTEQIVRSPIKMSKLLFDDWKLPVLKGNTSKKTGNVSRSTDKEVLHELAFIDNRAKDIRTYRESLNNRTKFVQTPLVAAEYNGDGYARPQAIVFGTYSGRMTYSSKQGKNKDERQIGWAIHQEKRGAEFRRVAIAPPGYTMMEFDAAGQEFRWMAVKSNDPVMLQLCMPGEDPHSFMGSRISGRNYLDLIAAVKVEDKIAKAERQLGKVGNLCIAKGEMVLTDRGPCSIEHVRPDDLVWDGDAFVAHDGVRSSGERWVIDNDGVMATPSHQVLVAGAWMAHDEAQRAGRQIDRAVTRTTGVRIVGGLVCRALREGWRALCAGGMSLWDRARRASEVSGDGPVYTVQGLRYATAASGEWASGSDRRRNEAFAEARRRMVSAVRKRQGSLMAKLRGAWDRMSFRVSGGSCGVYQANTSTSNVPEARHRPSRQRWSLRAWKLALGYTQSEPRQSQVVETFDIVNCGPRTRFAVNGRIVHNSLQYRTSARKLRVVARVDYNIPMNLGTARRIRSVYLRTYKYVPIYWENQIEQVATKGYAETFGGRRVIVQGDWGGENGWSMASTAINYPIQGTGADQKYMAMAMIREYIHEVGGRLMLDLHDGIYLLIPDHMVDEVAHVVKDILDNLPYESMWGLKLPIPMPWDCKVGKSWGDLKEYKYT